MAQHRLYLKTGDTDSRRRTLATARWLVENSEEIPSGGRGWYYQIDLGFYPVKAPWLSAMAQGEALSLLLRAYALDKDEAYPETANAAFKSFENPISTGGVCAVYPDGTLSLEEYPTDPPSHVLNGAIYALLGLYDFAQFFDTPVAKQLYSNALEGLRNNLPLYDTGYWSKYDLFPVQRLASRMYHIIHIRLLDTLFQLTGEPIFRDYSLKWNRYYHNPIRLLQWGLHKSRETLRNHQRKNNN